MADYRTDPRLSERLEDLTWWHRNLMLQTPDEKMLPTHAYKLFAEHNYEPNDPDVLNHVCPKMLAHLSYFAWRAQPFSDLRRNLFRAAVFVVIKDLGFDVGGKLKDG
jgi:hypothetical protein